MTLQAAHIETAVCLPGPRGPLVGIRCDPANPGEQPRPCVIIVAGQPQTRVGAHRMFVQLARRLAQGGLSSLRFDCSGWGDSPGTAEPFEASAADIVAVAKAMRAAHPGQPLVLLGLCDGATAAALSLPLVLAASCPVQALVLMNPWIDSQQMQARARVKHYYLKRLVSRQFWSHLLKGKVRLGDALGGAARALLQSTQAAGPPESVSARLAGVLVRSEVPLLLVLSGDDLTARSFSNWLQSQAGLRSRVGPERQLDLADADHTFSRPADWQRACQWMTERLGGLRPDG